MHAMVGLALWLGLALASGNVERELDGVGSASARLMALDGSRTLIVSRGGSSRDTRVVLLDEELEAQWEARVHISMEAPPLLKRRSLARLAPGIGDVPRAGSQVLVQRGETLNVLTTWGRRVVHHRVALASGAVEERILLEVSEGEDCWVASGRRGHVVVGVRQTDGTVSLRFFDPELATLGSARLDAFAVPDLEHLRRMVLDGEGTLWVLDPVSERELDLVRIRPGETRTWTRVDAHGNKIHAATLGIVSGGVRLALRLRQRKKTEMHIIRFDQRGGQTGRSEHLLMDIVGRRPGARRLLGVVPTADDGTVLVTSTLIGQSVTESTRLDGLDAEGTKRWSIEMPLKQTRYARLRGFTEDGVNLRLVAEDEWIRGLVLQDVDMVTGQGAAVAPLEVPVARRQSWQVSAVGDVVWVLVRPKQVGRARIYRRVREERR